MPRGTRCPGGSNRRCQKPGGRGRGGRGSASRDPPAWDGASACETAAPGRRSGGRDATRRAVRKPRGRRSERGGKSPLDSRRARGRDLRGPTAVARCKAAGGARVRQREGGEPGRFGKRRRAAFDVRRATNGGAPIARSVRRRRAETRCRARPTRDRFMRAARSSTRTDERPAARSRRRPSVAPSAAATPPVAQPFSRLDRRPCSRKPFSQRYFRRPFRRAFHWAPGARRRRGLSRPVAEGPRPSASLSRDAPPARRGLRAPGTRVSARTTLPGLRRVGAGAGEPDERLAVRCGGRRHPTPGASPSVGFRPRRRSAGAAPRRRGRSPAPRRGRVPKAPRRRRGSPKPARRDFASAGTDAPPGSRPRLAGRCAEKGGPRDPRTRWVVAPSVRAPVVRHGMRRASDDDGRRGLAAEVRPCGGRGHGARIGATSAGGRPPEG